MDEKKNKKIQECISGAMMELKINIPPMIHANRNNLTLNPASFLKLGPVMLLFTHLYMIFVFLKSLDILERKECLFWKVVCLLASLLINKKFRKTTWRSTPWRWRSTTCTASSSSPSSRRSTPSSSRVTKSRVPFRAQSMMTSNSPSSSPSKRSFPPKDYASHSWEETVSKMEILLNINKYIFILY